MLTNQFPVPVELYFFQSLERQVRGVLLDVASVLAHSTDFPIVRQAPLGLSNQPYHSRLTTSVVPALHYHTNVSVPTERQDRPSDDHHPWRSLLPIAIERFHYILCSVITLCGIEPRSILAIGILYGGKATPTRRFCVMEIPENVETAIVELIPGMTSGFETVRAAVKDFFPFTSIYDWITLLELDEITRMKKLTVVRCTCGLSFFCFCFCFCLDFFSLRFPRQYTED